MHRLILRFLIPIIIVSIVAILGIGIYGYKRFSDPSKSDHRLSIESIERIGKLELVRITVKDVLEQTKERPFGLPDAKALLIVVGHVTAGIDLEKVKKSDISTTETQITIRLPPPEIFLASVNHEESKVYDVKWGAWSTVKLLEDGWRTAEQAIRQVAINSKYHEVCKKNALLLLTPLFQELSGTKKIVIEFRN